MSNVSIAPAVYELELLDILIGSHSISLGTSLDLILSSISVS